MNCKRIVYKKEVEENKSKDYIFYKNLFKEFKHNILNKKSYIIDNGFIIFTIYKNFYKPNTIDRKQLKDFEDWLYKNTDFEYLFSYSEGRFFYKTYYEIICSFQKPPKNECK